MLVEETRRMSERHAEDVDVAGGDDLGVFVAHHVGASAAFRQCRDNIARPRSVARSDHHRESGGGEAQRQALPFVAGAANQADSRLSFHLPVGHPSRATAMPCPPPTHIVQRPVPPPMR